jgi:hypothetical protein
MTTQIETMETVDTSEFVDGTTGLWNNVMNREERVGVTVRKFIDLCKLNFKDFDEELLLSIVWNKGYKELLKYNTKAGRKEKAKKAIYTSSTLKKPPRSGYIIFNQEISNNFRTKGEKYDKSVVEKQWQNMSEKKKEKYKQRAKTLNDEYKAALLQEKNQAIKEGLFPMDKPKRPINEWIIFRTEIYNEVADMFKPDESKMSTMTKSEIGLYKKQLMKDIQSEIKRRWDNLSNETKQTYITKKEKMHQKYLTELEEWNTHEEARLAKLNEEKESMKTSIKLEPTSPSTSVLEEEQDTSEETENATGEVHSHYEPEEEEHETVQEPVQEPVQEEVEESITVESSEPVKVVSKPTKGKRGPRKNAKSKSTPTESTVESTPVVETTTVVETPQEPVESKSTPKKGKATSSKTTKSRKGKQKIIVAVSDTENSDTDSD